LKEQVLTGCIIGAKLISKNLFPFFEKGKILKESQREARPLLQK